MSSDFPAWGIAMLVIIPTIFIGSFITLTIFARRAQMRHYGTFNGPYYANKPYYADRQYEYSASPYAGNRGFHAADPSPHSSHPISHPHDYGHVHAHNSAQQYDTTMLPIYDNTSSAAMQQSSSTGVNTTTDTTTSSSGGTKDS